MNAVLPRFNPRLPTRRQIEAPLRAFIAFATILLMCATILHREDQDGFQASHLFFMPRRTWEVDQGRGMLYEEAYYERMDLEVLAEEVYGGYFPRESEREERHAPGRAEQSAPDPTSTSAYSDWLSAQRESYTHWFAVNRGQYADWLKTEAATFDEWLGRRPAGYRDAYEHELAGINFELIATTESEDETDDESISPGRQTQGQTVRREPHAPASGGTTLPIIGAADTLNPPDWLFEPAALPHSAPASREDDTPSPPPRAVDTV